MKLKTIAAAVAVASMPFAAQADVKIGGDVGVIYSSDTETIQESGSEINVDASETVNGVTYFGHLEMDIQGDAGAPNVSFEELRVGLKNDRIGEIRIGHTGDPGCGLVQVGGSYEIWKTHDKGGCTGTAAGAISWKKGFGPVTGAISHSPGADEFSVGLSGKVGPVSASVGYTDTDGDSTTAFALAGSLGPVGFGFRFKDPENGDSVHGLNLKYSAGNNHIYGGVETSDDGARSASIGYKRVIGKTDFAIEAVDSGASGSDTDYVIGMRHNF